VPEPILEVSTAVTPAGELTVKLTGEIDVSVVAEVDAVLGWAILGVGVHRVVVDLSGLRFIDARGSRALAAARQLAERAGIPVEITGARGHLATVLGLLGIIDIDESLRTLPGVQRADRRVH
jgi:anti-anti-sigma factor